MNVLFVYTAVCSLTSLPNAFNSADNSASKTSSNYVLKSTALEPKEK